ncbi:MAG: gliding motility lipoprotein GldH [Bacteroidales bacterium]|jgi:gliding motility-associated lipoprotein GldH|nr:gliding motility lipoprotein GldH [Bacteroidales bacterium]
MKRHYILLFFALVALSACNSNVLFDKNESIDDKGWSIGEKVSFELNIEDTITKYDFAINLRNTTDYPYSNVLFFITTIYPDNSVSRRDTVECYVANPDGSWKGKGSGKLKDNRFWFARSVQFLQKGNYTFEIEHAMRDTALTGLTDIGLHIENRRLK